MHAYSLDISVNMPRSRQVVTKYNIHKHYIKKKNEILYVSYTLTCALANLCHCYH